ncbi:PQQ-dependent sugar dehydrogenase [Rhizobium sp. AAP43]|uniref:PQQ-dependent sugar dehydrogenase n=1 Tax=Rhizobium sp. AAP43 TaxID=1523420 RepID=UPI0006B8B7FE|nr:PQQ-dependent sugar dehydrogenase [Rhizobium sp. AAP43]KPF45467.1 glucose dehydrogenase [Rhizobium sp. AAP43]
MKPLPLILASTMLTAGIIAAPAFAQTSGTPVETGSANAPDQKPAFDNQTRAPQPAQMPKIKTEVVADALPHLWAMEFLPDGRMLVTAKQGDMHIISKDGKPGPAIEGLPDVYAEGQGGLLDVALAPDYGTSGKIFFSFAEPRDDGNGTSVASARLVVDEAGGGKLEDVAVIFRQMPTYSGNKHFGSRLAFGPAGELYVTVGERSDAEPRVQAQDLASGLGKIFRISQTGEALPDNPFAGREGAQPEIWSLGHRNLQSATVDDKGRLWTVEHGPRGGDELNLPQAGKNYGWPEVTYGVEYSGDKVGDGVTQMANTEQPVYYWDPVIAPSGMAFYGGDAIPEWKGAFLVGGLVSQGVVVLHMENDRVKHEERLDLNARIRDVKVGPDGAVYAVTEQRGGGNSTILKLTKS